MLFQKPSLRTRVTFEAGMAQLGGHAIYLTEDSVMGAREAVRDVARNLERFVDAIVARTGPHEVVVRARGPGVDPGHQRADAARAPVPGAGRRVHDPGAVRGPARGGRHVRRRRQQRLPLAGAVGRRPRHGGPPGPSAALRARSSGSSSGHGSSPRPPVGGCLRRRPGRARARRRHRLHRRVDLDGPGGRDGGASRRLRPLSRGRRAAGRGRTGASWRCIACPPIGARRSPRPSWTAPRSLICEQSENRLHVQKALLVELLADEAPTIG